MKLNQLWYGGDYNPEQWPTTVWDDDVQLMRRAGVNVVTVGVFSWAHLEPSDGQFTFDWLDDVLDRLHDAGIGVDLATATASPPPWLTTAHPEVLPVTETGVVLSAGSRQHYSPSSGTYRRYADRLVRAIAERYGTHPAVVAWHVNNELACHVHEDFSDESAEAFRAWLIDRYSTIDALNHAWGTAFWSQRYSAFAEILPPRAAPTFSNPTQSLDWKRFSSEAWLRVFRAEAAILRAVAPNVPITTNFMSFHKPTDYWAHAAEVDFVSEDHYVDPASPTAAFDAAMTRDLMRSLGGGKPWVLMEQATSAVNWRPRNAPIPAGQHRTLSFQAVARGADGIMQFQWRQSRAGAEKFHSAMLPHGGEETRIFRETVDLGADLEALAPVVGTTVDAQVAIVLDWDSWWALEQAATPASLQYIPILRRWHRAFMQRGITVDFVPATSTVDLARYAVVVAPALHVLPADVSERLAAFVRDGGRLVVGYQSGVLDENLHVHLGGYLGGLQDVLGLHVEEFAPPAEPWGSGLPAPTLQISGLAAGAATEWGEIVRIHDADVQARFVGGFLDGEPAISSHRHGRGVAWYVATAPADLLSVIDAVLEGAKVVPTVGELPDGTEAVRRGDKLFLLNHGAERVEIAGVDVPAYGAVIRDLGPVGEGAA